MPKNCWWSVQAKKNILSVKLHFYQFLISSFPLISDLRQFSYSNSERASNSTCFDISFVKIGAGLCEISQIAVLRRRNCVGGFFWWHRVETLNQTRCAKFQLIPTIFQFYRGHPSCDPGLQGTRHLSSTDKPSRLRNHDLFCVVQIWHVTKACHVHVILIFFPNPRLFLLIFGLKPQLGTNSEIHSPHFWCLLQ